MDGNMDFAEPSLSNHRKLQVEQENANNNEVHLEEINQEMEQQVGPNRTQCFVHVEPEDAPKQFVPFNYESDSGDEKGSFSEHSIVQFLTLHAPTILYQRTSKTTL